MKLHLKSTILSSLLLIGLFNQANSFKNEVFKNSIKTVIIENENKLIDFPLTFLNSPHQLTIRFDDIANEVKQYSYTFIHCNSNWEQSKDLFTSDYIDGYEEEEISDYQLSVNTAVNYIHYAQSFPSENLKFTKSGNYILFVFEDADKSKVVLTQKFYVANIKTEVTPKPSIPIEFDYKYTHHQIDFNVNYQLIKTNNALNEFRVVVLQNDRMDNLKKNIRPLYVKQNELIFSNTSATRFEAGNEYRILDFRDIKLKGNGVEQIFYKDSIYHVLPFKDSKRAYLKYSSQYDHNGDFFTSLLPKNRNPYLESEYAFVHFRLGRKVPLDNSTVFLIGAFTSNELKREHSLIYKDSLEHYEAHIMLKQGVYDYAYVAMKNKTSELKWEDTDGSHHQTENNYTILVYYKGFGQDAEQLVGFKRFIFQ
jgi:hypothetical protein|tara:strand:+ start:4799 stop:6067 length:1269 start_codon:yes stop_codon:yes gene_type:complete